MRRPSISSIARSRPRQLQAHERPGAAARAALGARTTKASARPDRLGDRARARGQRSRPPPCGIASRPWRPSPREAVSGAAGGGDERARARGDGDRLAVARAQARVALLQLEPQRGLHGARRRRRHGEARGWTVETSPVRSITPISAPVSGSWIGAAEHVQRCTSSLKCSGAEDLHGVVDGQRGADGVRARARLAPQRALGEVHASAARMRMLRAALDVSSTPLASLTTTR